MILPPGNWEWFYVDSETRERLSDPVHFTLIQETDMEFPKCRQLYAVLVVRRT